MQFTPKKSFDCSFSKSPHSSGKASPPLAESGGGRFIPNRIASNLTSVFEKAEDTPNFRLGDENTGYFNALLQSELFGSDITNFSEGHRRNILRYKPSTPSLDNKENLPFEALRLGPDMPEVSVRKVSKVPYKVLDAPNLTDDYYLNLLDWSSRDLLAVALYNSVYLWAPDGTVQKLCELEYGTVTSVAWTYDSRYIAVGTSFGSVKVFDPELPFIIREYRGHSERVGALAWNEYLLASGSRDRSILQRDLNSYGDIVSKLIGHKQEVCGLKWSPEREFLASGGNDNKLMIWSPESTSPITKFSGHRAAVKALAWSPHQRGLLVSGGGTADRTIRFWDSQTSQALQVLDSHSQVCCLMFSTLSNELVSTHGYSENQIVVWKYPSLQKVAVLLGHKSRVLYLAMSADGQNIVTGAGDETLRFWSAFAKPQTTNQVLSAMLPNFSELR